MTELEERLTEAGLGRVAGRLAPLTRESVRLTAVKYEEKPACRLGGRPNLAPDLSWPVWDKTPLSFIAQLDLAALPKVAGLDLPRSGALYFFNKVQEHASSVENRGNFRVLYTSEALALLPLHDFPEQLDEEFRYKGVRLEVEGSALSVALPRDPVLSSVRLNSEEEKRYQEFCKLVMESRPKPRKTLRGARSNHIGEHEVGGYPIYIQHDPRLRTELITTELYPRIKGRGRNPATGLSVTSKEDEPLLVKAEAAMQDWLQLFLVDSEQSADIIWGDMGRFYYLIRKGDLKKRAFESVWMEFDCY
jgi:uncharacterized protein YwqG